MFNTRKLRGVAACVHWHDPGPTFAHVDPTSVIQVLHRLRELPTCVRVLKRFRAKHSDAHSPDPARAITQSSMASFFDALLQDGFTMSENVHKWMNEFRREAIHFVDQLIDVECKLNLLGIVSLK